jgi:hypothetical protein
MCVRVQLINNEVEISPEEAEPKKNQVLNTKKGTL